MANNSIPVSQNHHYTIPCNSVTTFTYKQEVGKHKMYRTIC